MSHRLRTNLWSIRWLVLTVLVGILPLILLSCTGVDGQPLVLALPEVQHEKSAGTSSQGVSSQLVTAHSGLMELLSYTPYSVTDIYFTDWAALKTHFGMEHLTSGATEAEYELFRSSLADISVTSFYASNHPFSSHAENWGWNTLDLLWEAHLTPKDSVFVYILKFRPGFDFAPVMERFRQRDYEEAERDGLHIFLGGSNMLVESIRTSELSIRNATIDTANSLMFLSGDSDNFAEFQEARAAQRTMADWPEMADTARQLSPTFAAVLRPGLDTCHRLGSRPMMDAMFRGESAESLRQMIEDSPMLAPYQVFGLGYRFEEINEENSAVWSLVMHYPDASLAQADLEVRKRIIAEMYSLQEPDRLYSDLVDVRSAEVVGNQMVLRLHAVNGNPRLVLNMFFHDDMFFASC